MANTSKSKSETKITRISATDAPQKNVDSPKPARQATKKVTPKTEVKAEKVKKTADQSVTKTRRHRRNPLRAIGQYFKGSWYELRQVRWPDRRATWSMTGALLIFTIMFLVVILLLDYGFSELFKLIMGTK